MAEEQKKSTTQKVNNKKFTLFTRFTRFTVLKLNELRSPGNLSKLCKQSKLSKRCKFAMLLFALRHFVIVSYPSSSPYQGEAGGVALSS